MTLKQSTTKKHDLLSGVRFDQHHNHSVRAIIGFFHGLGRTTLAMEGAGPPYRVYLHPINIPFTCTVDRIIYWIATPSAGNVRAGIYPDNGDTPAGSSPLVQSASVAKPAAYNQHAVTIADTQLTPGLHWLALHGDELTTVLYMDNVAPLPGGPMIGYYFDQAYGVLPDPCPAVTRVPTALPFMYVRVASVP